MTDLSAEKRGLIARLAGLAYLSLILVGGYGHLSTGGLVDMGDPSATARNLLASEHVWRIGITAMFLMLIADVAVAALFFVLLEPAGRVLALVAAFARLVTVALLGVSLTLRWVAIELLAHSHAALGAVDGAISAFEFLVAAESLFSTSFVFFGVACFALASLFLRSAFIPRVFGLLFACAGLSYLFDSVAKIIAPGTSLPFDVLLIAYAAEAGLALWLTFIGARQRKHV